MYKNATKCNETIGKWCKTKHGASKIIDTFETYQLCTEPDVRALARCGKREGSLSVADMYKLCSFDGVDAPFAAFVWESFIPSKVKLFV
jgi:hypothetical protein